MQHTRQICRQSGALEPLAKVGCNVGLGQIVQRQLHTLAVLLELREDRTQWMALDKSLRGSIGPENQEASGIGTPGNICEPFQRRTIAPVKIFRHEQQWLLSREGLQALGQLAQHPPLCGTAYCTLERLPLGGGQQSRHLHQPTGGTLPQHRHETCSMRFPAQASQRLQHGQIRFPSTIGLHTLSVSYREVLPGRHLGHKGIDQGGLADTWLPGDDPHLARALERRGGPLVHLSQFALTPEKSVEPTRATGKGRRNIPAVWCLSGNGSATASGALNRYPRRCTV